MAIYTKEKFKELWDSPGGGGITIEDIADCAKDWGLFQTPRIHPIEKVQKAVIKAAGCTTCPSCDSDLFDLITNYCVNCEYTGKK